MALVSLWWDMDSLRMIMIGRLWWVIFFSLCITKLCSLSNDVVLQWKLFSWAWWADGPSSHRIPVVFFAICKSQNWGFEFCVIYYFSFNGYGKLHVLKAKIRWTFLMFSSMTWCSFLHFNVAYTIHWQLAPYKINITSSILYWYYDIT